MTAIVDFVCIIYYSGRVSGMMVLANFILLIANGCCGVIGSLRLELIVVLCSVTWVLIIMIVYIMMLIATFAMA